MIFIVSPSKLSGEVEIPASKSHTIRSVFFALLADGTSVISKPLISEDAESAAAAAAKLGARVSIEQDEWRISGVNAHISDIDTEIDTGNSGTTIRIAAGTAALARKSRIRLTGDDQIRRRPIGQLVQALSNLGSDAACELANGCPPVLISRAVSGGFTTISSPSSQFLTSLLINMPFADRDTEIEVLLLNEKPYVDMTLWWMDRLGIRYERSGYDRFMLPGGQRIKSFSMSIPGDFSSATFFAVAAAVTSSELNLRGLDMSDVQGDKAVLDILRDMGAEVSSVESGVRIKGKPLHGGEYDLNATPDALPALAVAACAASGETRLVNVPQARMKETDRIAVMSRELTKLGANVTELEDGMIIRGGPLTGAPVRGHSDHRIVMSLAVAGLIAAGRTEIDTAESAAITFPTFFQLMQNAGAAIEKHQ